MSNFNFTSQVCTSRSQSERLLALGLNKGTADCHYEGRKNRYEEWEVSVIGGCYYSWDFPAWSLHRLIEMANTYIEISPFTGVYFRDGAFSTDRVNDYDAIIDIIEWLIKEGDFNKEYL